MVQSNPNTTKLKRIKSKKGLEKTSDGDVLTDSPNVHKKSTNLELLKTRLNLAPDVV